MYILINFSERLTLKMMYNYVKLICIIDVSNQKNILPFFINILPPSGIMLLLYCSHLENLVII